MPGLASRTSVDRLKLSTLVQLALTVHPLRQPALLG